MVSSADPYRDIRPVRTLYRARLVVPSNGLNSACLSSKGYLKIARFRTMRFSRQSTDTARQMVQILPGLVTDAILCRILLRVDKVNAELLPGLRVFAKNARPLAEVQI
jgi:hypothetical protein